MDLPSDKRLIAVFIISFLLTSMLSVQRCIDNHVELIVGVSDMSPKDLKGLMDLASSCGGKVVNIIRFGLTLEAVVLDLPSSSQNALISHATKFFKPMYIEQNIKFKAYFYPNDPYWPKQWNLMKIRADYAWNKTMGNPSILVAVIDTGVDYNHSDLAPNYAPLGFDWVNNDNDPMDDHGHGTHVAGIVASVINNMVGTAGIAQVRIMAEKGLNQSGEGYADDLANAISHAVDQGAQILVMSWGSNSSSVLINRAVKYAYRKGALLVGAAGNDASSQKIYPAAYDEVMAVSATDKLDNAASFTNYGDWIEIAAPGVNIYSTIRYNGYGYMSGTSMAAPHVAGVAALIWSVFPELSRDQVRQRLRETADDLGTEGFDIYYGYGRVNAWRAVAIHDIAVIGVSPNKEIVSRGSIVEIYVNVTNKGEDTESFNIILQANETTVQAANLTLTSGGSTAITFTWNTANHTIGNYTISVYVNPVPGENNLTDNTYIDGTVQIIPLVDIAISNITFSKQYPTVNETIQIYVTIENQGESMETFSLYVNASNTINSLVGTQTITLASGEALTVNFTWTPTTGGEHKIKAYTSQILDVNPTNNILIAYIYVIQDYARASSKCYYPYLYVGDY